MKLVDPHGRSVSAEKKPLAELIGTMKLRDQFSTYPSVKLTPERLAGIFREADAGDVVRQAELFEEMEEKDPVLGSVLQTRKLALLGLDYEIIPASDSSEDKQIADHVRENFQDIDFEDLLMELADSIGKGFAAVEIMWQMIAGRVWASGFEWIHQKRFTFNEMGVSFDGPLPKLPRLLTDKEPIRGEEIPAFKIIYHRYKARSGFPTRGGILRPVSYYYLFKNYAIKDWVVFLEKFGQPLRLGKFQAGATPGDLKVLREAIRDLGTDAGAIISDQTMIEMLEAKTTQASSDLYQRFVESVDKSFEIAVLGQNATTEGTPGKLGAETARAEVRRDLLSADARAIAETIRWQLFWPMVGYNFGWDKSVPKIVYAIVDPEDLNQLAATHDRLARLGLDIPVSFVRKKYGIPEPEGNEPVLRPPAQPSFPSFPTFPPLFSAVRVPVGSRMVEIDQRKVDALD